MAATEYVCMASGPSLTAEDAEIVRRWREGNENRRVIVTNTTFRMAPWADVLYAMDASWIHRYRQEFEECFGGTVYTRLHKVRGVITLSTGIRPIQLEKNSGAGAIQLAAHWGAKRIVLLGYDCQRTGGRSHWHGDHPPGLGNARSLPNWPRMFYSLAKSLAGLCIINSSRATALTVFPREPLRDALAWKSPDGITADISETEAQD